MTIEILKENYAVCKLNNKSDADLRGEFVSLTITDNEISLVCEESKIPCACKVEKGWRALMIKDVLDFSLVGILAKIANILADEEISIFALSTYDTDYILVKQDMLQRTIIALTKQGYEVVGG